MVITKQRIQEILVNDMQLDEEDVEMLEFFILKEETLTPEEAGALDEVYGVIRSYMGGKMVEATLHTEMMKLGREFERDPDDILAAHEGGWILAAEYNV